MYFVAAKCFAPTELEEWPGRLAYKHLVPLGPKTTAKNKDRSVNEPLGTRHQEKHDTRG
jgi:hypothetical protein